MPSQIVQQQLHDLAFQNNHVVPMKFYPAAWLSAQHSSRTWYSQNFPPEPRSSIPTSPGVYVFVVTPDIFNFEPSSGLFYIGKATNLYSRIGAYISEIDKDFRDSQRPHIWRMLNLWGGHFKYYYTTTQNVAEAETLENEMLNAFRPPFNKQYDAETSPNERAFP